MEGRREWRGDERDVERDERDVERDERDERDERREIGIARDTLESREIVVGL